MVLTNERVNFGMNQCPNCDAKDQITIAGKTFCANCGTPLNASAVPADTKSTVASATPATPAPTVGVPVATTTPPAAEPTVVNPTSPLASLNQSTSAPAGVASPLSPPSPEPAMPPAQSPAQPQPAIAQPAPEPPLAAPEAPPTTAPTPLPTPQPTPHQPAPTPIDPNQPGNQAAVELSSVVQKGQDEAALQRLLQKTQSAPTPKTTQPTRPATLPQENLGSELGTLDGKSETIFSDAQLNELAQATQSPLAGATSTKPTAMTDIQPPATSFESQLSSAHAEPTASHSFGSAVAAPAAQQVAQAATATAPPSILPPTSRVTAPMTDIRPATAATGPIVEMPLPDMAAPKPPRPGSLVGPATTSMSPQVNNKPVVATGSAPAVAAVASGQTQGGKSSKSSVFKPATVALSMVGMVLVGLYVWQINYPNLAFKVASGKAGINASLPNYLPSGWRVAGNIQSSPGVISYNLSSGDNNQRMNVQETKSDWDSQALAENYVAQKSDNYLALQSQGLTIYMYGNNQASWINNGTWYRLEGDHSGLNQDQVIKIATSL